jgi:hypothetical protein
VTALAIIAAAELALITFLIWERTRALTPLLATIAELCQRLQAPGAAVLAHDEAARGRPPAEYAPPALEPDDDESYWMSREKLAEYAMNEETGGGA